VLRTDDSIRALRDRVEAALGTETGLVDVRSPAEFAGEIISPAGYEQERAQRAGHIPGVTGSSSGVLLMAASRICRHCRSISWLAANGSMGAT